MHEGALGVNPDPQIEAHLLTYLLTYYIEFTFCCD